MALRLDLDFEYKFVSCITLHYIPRVWRSDTPDGGLRGEAEMSELRPRHPDPLSWDKNRFCVAVHVYSDANVPAAAADLPAPGLGPRDLEAPGPPAPPGDVSLGSAPGENK